MEYKSLSEVVMPTATWNESMIRSPKGRSRAIDVDRHVGMRIRERRLILGMTQQQMAEAIGVTYQQGHKYEKGINRTASGRLYQIAQALGVEVSYFFEGLEVKGEVGVKAFRATEQQRLLLELARNFLSIPDKKHQQAICDMARSLSDPEALETYRG